MISVAYVDDDPHIALMICLLCQRQGGIRMHAFSSGTEILEDLSNFSVDVIISDFDMPGMNGIELLATIRSKGDQIPFILFTDLEQMEEIGQVVDRYSSAWILSKEFILRGQVHYLVTMIRMAAQHSAVRKR